MPDFWSVWVFLCSSCHPHKNVSEMGEIQVTRMTNSSFKRRNEKRKVVPSPMLMSGDGRSYVSANAGVGGECRGECSHRFCEAVIACTICSINAIYRTRLNMQVYAKHV